MGRRNLELLITTLVLPIQMWNFEMLERCTFYQRKWHVVEFYSFSSFLMYLSEFSIQCVLFFKLILKVSGIMIFACIGSETANMHCICNLMKNFAKPKELTHRSKTLLLFSCIFGWGSLYISNVCSRWKSSSSKGFHSMALVVLLKDYAVVVV